MKAKEFFEKVIENQEVLTLLSICIIGLIIIGWIIVFFSKRELTQALRKEFGELKNTTDLGLTSIKENTGVWSAATSELLVSHKMQSDNVSRVSDYVDDIRTDINRCKEINQRTFDKLCHMEKR